MKKLSFFASAIAVVTFGFSMPAMSGTYSIGADTGCNVELGSASGSNDYGLKNNSTGSAVISCSVPRGSRDVSSVRVRMRNGASGAGSTFCSTVAFSTTGGNKETSNNYWFPSSTGGHDKAIYLPPTQYSYGYFDVWCVLAPGDTLYGIRYTN